MPLYGRGKGYLEKIKGINSLIQFLVLIASLILVITITGSLSFPNAAKGLSNEASVSNQNQLRPTGKTLITGTGINDNVKPGYMKVTVNTDSEVGKVNENVIGVNQLSYPAEVRPMKNIGIRYVRIDASLEGSVNSTDVYNCSTGIWSPKLLEPRIKLAQEAGAVPELIIDYSPKCLEPEINGSPPNSNYYPPDLGTDLPKWESLISQVGNWAIKNGVRYFEVWNEPDWTFYTGNALSYSQLYANTVTPLELQAKDQNVKIFVGGPAMADVLDQIDSQFLKTFLGYISQRNIPLNFVSWHTYADDPNAGTASFLKSGLCLTNHLEAPGVPCYFTPTMNTQIYASEVSAVKSILKKYPMYKPQLWIDEWNLNAESDPRQNTPYASAFLLSAIEKAASAGISVMEWYNTADYPPGNYQGFGLLNQQLKPKASYLGYLLWHKMTGDLLKTDVSRKTSNPYQHPSAVASLTSNDTLNVLVNNYVSYDVTGNFGSSETDANLLNCKLTVVGLKAGATYTVKYSTISLKNQNSLVRTQKILTASGDGKLNLNITIQEESTTMISIVNPKSQSGPSDSFLLVMIVALILVVISAVSAIFLVKRTKKG
jgi:uncharacterized protein YjeT (DUF2065 family)